MSAGGAIDFPWLRKIRVTFSGLPKPLESTGKQDALRITATVHKEIMGLPPSTEILLYNLSTDTRKALVRSETRVTIEAGWEQGPRAGMKECFKGTLLTSYTTRRKATTITRVNAMSGLFGMSEAHEERTFPPGMKVSLAVLELAMQIKGVTVEPKNIKGIKGVIPKSGWSCCRPAKDILDMLGKEFSFSWTIIDDVFYAIGDEDAFGVTATIKHPNIISVDPLLSGVRRYMTGVRWRCVFDSGITPMYFSRIESQVEPDMNGDYRVNAVTHYLDCFDDGGFTSSGWAHILGKRNG